MGWLLCLPTVAAVGAELSDAQVMSKQALAFYQQGKFRVAAQLYERAYQLDPSHPEFLYGAGRAEHKAGRLWQAKQYYERLLERVPADSPHGVKGTQHLAAVTALLRHQREASEVRQTDQPPRPAAPATPAAPWAMRKKLGVGALIGGTALVVTGIFVHAGASADNAALTAQLEGSSPTSLVTTMTYEQALARREDANGRIRMSWLLAGAGIAGLGAASWLLLSAPSGKRGVALTPTVGGAQLAVRF